MPLEPSDIPEQRRLPAPGEADPPGAAAAMPLRQLQDLPADELRALGEELGLDTTKYKSPQQLVAAIHERRQLIATFDREAMLDVIKWGRRPVPASAARELLAQEIVKIHSMRFSGLSHRGLIVLARLRGADVLDQDDTPTVVRKLKKLEGLFAKLNRKRRALIGSVVSKLMGESPPSQDYQFLETNAPTPEAPPSPTAGPSSVKRDIEESGLFGGLAGRIKREADTYINQKLDEIESRIDRKLDEIDRRLAEWRDKEIANRLRILKITLWASVIVAGVSLLYSYIKLLATVLMGK